MSAHAVRAGVDIGGTFTDVAVDAGGALASAKVLTDHAAPERAILSGLAEACARAEVALGDVGQIVHGTTLVTNALIERRGARTAFVTTEGFRDVVEMRSENRFEQYDLNLELPTPLVGRADRYTVSERIAADGAVLRPLEAAAADAVADAVVSAGYDAVAVGFLHAYANDAHERAMADALRRRAPDASISLSSVVSPQMRELPRFTTVIANAYVQPIVASYLGRLRAALREAGARAQLVMMHSGGGLFSVDTAIEQPVRLLESGPAGGAIFAAAVARAHGVDRALSFDMGGTTAKICLIEGGAPKTAASFEVARTYRFKKGSGMTVSTPVVEMVEIGAGGGSIASVDALNRIQVGPRSAGSEPGPACYGRGGAAATVTDANLALGRLDPDAFAGGAIRLSTDAAVAALASDVGAPLEFDPSTAAVGVLETVDEAMANAARAHTVETGRDVERFTVVAFGGGAPLHACRLCEKLGIDRALVPPGAGVGSAIGFLRAPVSYEAVRGARLALSRYDAAAAGALIEAMASEAAAFVAEAAPGATTRQSLTAHMRYAGQGFEIPVPVASDAVADGDAEALRGAFEDAYAALFGRTIDGLDVEVANLSLAVATDAPPVARTPDAGLGAAAAAGRLRRIYDAAAKGLVDAAEIPRTALAPGVSIDGPAAIVERETTTIVTSRFRAVGRSDGSILLIRKDAAL